MAVTERLRDCEPPPHDWEHVDQAPKAEVAQWIGHVVLLQERASNLCGQALPPLVGAVRARLRFCEPVAQVTVHVDHAENVPMTQSVAHACALQSRVSAECGHALPPNVGSVMERLRFCEPVPHDLVHVDQAPNVAS